MDTEEQADVEYAGRVRPLEAGGAVYVGGSKLHMPGDSGNVNFLK